MSEKFQHFIAMTLSITAFLLLLVNFSLGASNRAKSSELLTSQQQLEMAQLTTNLYKKVVTLTVNTSLRSKDTALLTILSNSSIDVSRLTNASKDDSSN